MKQIFDSFAGAEPPEKAVSVDIQKEYLRQRTHLEQTILAMKDKAEKDSELHRRESMRIMQENVTLIKFHHFLLSVSHCSVK